MTTGEQETSSKLQWNLNSQEHVTPAVGLECETEESHALILNLLFASFTPVWVFETEDADESTLREGTGEEQKNATKISK